MVWVLVGVRGCVAMDAGHGLVTIDRICLAVHRGVSHDGRFVGGGARDRNRIVTQGTETTI